MDLISELGNDVLAAYLLEKDNSKKLEPKQLIELLGRIDIALRPISHSDPDRTLLRRSTVRKPAPGTDYKI